MTETPSPQTASLVERLHRIVPNAGSVTIFDMMAAEHRVTCDTGAACKTTPILMEAKHAIREAASTITRLEQVVKAIVTAFDEWAVEDLMVYARNLERADLETLSRKMDAARKCLSQTPNPQTPKKRLTMARIIMDGWRDDNTPQTQTGRICGEMVIGEGGESAGICDKPYGHAGKHPTMPYDEYKRRLSQTPEPPLCRCGGSGRMNGGEKECDLCYGTGYASQTPNPQTGRCPICGSDKNDPRVGGNCPTCTSAGPTPKREQR